VCLRTQAVSKKPGFIPKRRAMSIEESQKISTTLIPPPTTPFPSRNRVKKTVFLV